MLTEIGGQIGWLASEMNFRFKNPVYFGDTVTCTLTITQIDHKNRARAKAQFKNRQGTVVLEAELAGILPGDRERQVLRAMVEEGDPTNMPVKSLNSSVLKWPDQKAVDRAVRAWSIEQGRRRPELKQLGYFGSYACGDWGVGSDLDLIAVVDDATEPFERRALNWELNSFPVPAEILVYTVDEWNAMQKKSERFIRVINKEVIWTYFQNA
jgi:predicted nucleotidyltransferase